MNRLLVVVLLVPALAGCVGEGVPGGAEPVQSATGGGIGSSTAGTLLPGGVLRWTGAQSAQVVLEGPEGERTLCEGAERACLLPPELEGDAEYTWWVRGFTPLGTMRSDPFSFRTPASEARVEVAATPDLIPATGGLTWSSNVDATHALLRFGEESHVCTSASGCTTASELPPGPVTGSVVAVDARGLRTTHDLGTLQVAAPPVPGGALEPRDGREVAAGTVELRWAKAVSPDGVAVQQTVEVWTSKDQDWRPVVSQDGNTTLDVPAGTDVAWRVIAEDALGQRRVGPMHRFHTVDAPPTPVPTGLLRTAPLAAVPFTWSPSTETLHEVEARVDGEWVPACEGTDACSARLDLQPGATVAWRVRAVSGYQGTSGWGYANLTTNEPIVLLHDIQQTGASLAGDVEALLAAGEYVVDFEPAPGVQALTFAPREGQGLQSLAVSVVEPAILDALADAGLDSTYDLVGHAGGGLVARAIAAHGGAPDSLDDVVTLGSPNGGTWLAVATLAVDALSETDALAAIHPGLDTVADLAAGGLHAVYGDWTTAVMDLAADSPFLSSLAGTVFGAVGVQGDPLAGASSSLAGSAWSVLLPIGKVLLAGLSCGLGCALSAGLQGAVSYFASNS